MENLKYKVFESISVKRGIRGSGKKIIIILSYFLEIASILRLLVKYANSYTFPKLPSVWSGCFICFAYD
jgi:hypothetical protein